MKAKSAIYYLTLIIFILIPIALGYYIFVNTVMANSVLPNIRLNSSDVSFYSEDQLKSTIESKALQVLPKSIEVNFEGNKQSVNTQDIDLGVDTYDLVNYGKGNDLLKVISQGINLFRGVEVNVNYTLNVNYFLSKLGVDLYSSTPSKIENSKFYCTNNQFAFSSLDKNRLETSIINSLKTSSEFKLNLADYLSSDNEKLLYTGCLKYKNEYPLIKKFFLDKLSTSINFDDIFELDNQSGIAQWKVKDFQVLTSAIDKYKSALEVQPNEGEYELVNNNQIYLYKPYVEGSVIDTAQSVSLVYAWLNSGDLGSTPLVFKQIEPKVLSYGLPILDFTQEIGTGKTRIELIRNGYDNFVIAYTMFGLDEINKTVVNAGEEFSYIKAIDPQPNGTTKSGRPIAGGICNSTTTLFRAVLESGFPVTDRSYHAYYVPSYEWGYPLNIVDAAYFTDPVVDFKFKNDSEYPILMKVEYTKDSDYQYNTVHILSSSKAIKRDVVLSNWKVWDKFSSTNFKGSFDRSVSIDGKLLFSDNFYSHYL